MQVDHSNFDDSVFSEIETEDFSGNVEKTLKKGAVSQALSGPGGLYSRYFKRVFDIVLVLVALVPIAVIMTILYFSVRRDGGAFLYSHVRTGRAGKRFGCFKIRTMVPDADKALADLLASDPDRAEEWKRTHKLNDDPRVTQVGQKLRSTGLDELPQVFNILKGDMSVVGPRPITDGELSEYDLEGQHAYRKVRPGLTGLWQVTLRRQNDFVNRDKIDRMYVDQMSFLGDVRIILRTVPEILGATGK